MGIIAVEKSEKNMQKFSVEARALEIRRDYYLKKLISKKHNGLIKVINGMSR